MDNYISLRDQVFSNPYVIDVITQYLDVRSLSNCLCVDNKFQSAAQYRLRWRRGYQLVSIKSTTNSAIPVFDQFSQWSQTGLKMVPKVAIVLLSGHQKSVDGREFATSVRRLADDLPNGCLIHFILTGQQLMATYPENSIQLMASGQPEADDDNQDDNPHYQHPNVDSFTPRLSMLLMSADNDIVVRSYRSFDGIDTVGVKCVLVFRSQKLLNRQKQTQLMKNQFNTSVRQLVVDQFDNQIAFGGGIAVGAKLWRKGDPTRPNLSPVDDKLRGLHEPYWCDPLVITIGGSSVRAASLIMNTFMHFGPPFHQQLLRFRSGLGFHTDNNTDESVTVAYLFGNRHVFYDHHNITDFRTIFATIFPGVQLYAFNSKRQLWGKNYVPDPQQATQITDNSTYNQTNWRYQVVLVLVNYQLNRFGVQKVYENNNNFINNNINNNIDINNDVNEDEDEDEFDDEFDDFDGF